MTSPQDCPIVHQPLIPEKQDRGSIASLVDSAAVKLLQQILTLVLLPMAVWGVNLVFDKLGKIESTMQVALTTAATFEVRIQSLERQIEAKSLQLRALEDRQRALEADFRSLIGPPPHLRGR